MPDYWKIMSDGFKDGKLLAITPDNLRIADNATLILPLHRDLDALRESGNAIHAIGTTQRGIGPAYEDKVGRRAIRVADLADREALEAKIDRLLAHHTPLRSARPGAGLPDWCSSSSSASQAPKRPPGLATRATSAACDYRVNRRGCRP